jgi:hypothetical protein
MSDTTTQDNFLKAFASINFTPAVFEYRVYYNADTKECVSKGIDNQPGTYIIVDKDKYESIEFCPNYYVKDNEVVKKKLTFTQERILTRSYERTDYAAMKDNNIFAAADEESFANALDYWSVRDWDE